MTQPNDRAAEVFDAAMTLIAERGYAGASLRELARRLDMSQPSLYHYFDTKDDLITKVIQTHTARTFVAGQTPRARPELNSLEALFQHVLDHVITSWERPAHVTFTRFLIAIHLHRPDLSTGLGDQFALLGLAGLRPDITRLAAEHSLSETSLEAGLRLAIDTMVGRFLQNHLLGVGTLTPYAPRDHADLITEIVLHGLTGRTTPPSL